MRVPAGELTPDGSNDGCGAFAAFVLLGIPIFLIATCVGKVKRAATEVVQRANHTLGPSPRSIAATVNLAGLASYAIDIDHHTITVHLDTLVSAAPYGHSGSLGLSVWISDSCCYDGGRINGVRIASWNLDEIDGGWQRTGIVREADFESGDIARGREQFLTLTLTEYFDGQRWITRWVAFEAPFVVPPARSWWRRMRDPARVVGDSTAVTFRGGVCPSC